MYYVSEEAMKRATNFGRENLISLGTRLGKFSKSGKFRMHITALTYLAPYAKVSLPSCCCPILGVHVEMLANPCLGRLLT